MAGPIHRGIKCSGVISTPRAKHFYVQEESKGPLILIKQIINLSAFKFK